MLTSRRWLTPALLPSAVLLPRASDDPPVTISRDPAKEAARRELSKRMYHENDPGLLHRLLNRFLSWVHHLFNAASGVTPGGGLGLFVVVLLVLALALALWWRLGTPRRAPASAAPLFHDRPRSAAEHRATAEAHAAQGHWNQAVQERMRAVVRALEERALLEPRPGRTADEAAAEAALALPTHEDRLRAAARDFDDVAYGGRSSDEPAYRRMSALDEDLARARPALTGAGASSNTSSHSTTNHSSTSARRTPE
ncbi:DUF4129 domain-containing protein [Streptomyces sp. TS71-3]|uniref:DUF4129 domain-containing protein n=1 Tax=Streptomyces sp. TS71-3 TaxID=2733862 RepID=UPI0035ABB0A6